MDSGGGAPGAPPSPKKKKRKQKRERERERERERGGEERELPPQIPNSHELSWAGPAGDLDGPQTPRLSKAPPLT